MCLVYACGMAEDADHITTYSLHYIGSWIIGTKANISHWFVWFESHGRSPFLPLKYHQSFLSATDEKTLNGTEVDELMTAVHSGVAG